MVISDHKGEAPLLVPELIISCMSMVLGVKQLKSFRWCSYNFEKLIFDICKGDKIKYRGKDVEKLIL